jgi:hypothetical protein
MIAQLRPTAICCHRVSHINRRIHNITIIVRNAETYNRISILQYVVIECYENPFLQVAQQPTIGFDRNTIIYTSGDVAVGTPLTQRRNQQKRSFALYAILASIDNTGLAAKKTNIKNKVLLN